MGIDGRLDLPRGDVLAAAPDAVLHPVDEEQEAVLVDPAAVARVEPEVPPGLDRVIGALVVAAEEREAALGPRDDLAGDVRRAGLVVLVDDPDVVRRGGTAGRADAPVVEAVLRD